MLELFWDEEVSRYLTILCRIPFRKRRLYNYDVLPLLILR